jgi:peptidoglycan/xylan/chitin deacetylase (PgdA/CDA1 family)
MQLIKKFFLGLLVFLSGFLVGGTAWATIEYNSQQRECRNILHDVKEEMNLSDDYCAFEFNLPEEIDDVNHFFTPNLKNIYELKNEFETRKRDYNKSKDVYFEKLELRRVISPESADPIVWGSKTNAEKYLIMNRRYEEKAKSINRQVSEFINEFKQGIDMLSLQVKVARELEIDVSIYQEFIDFAHSLKADGQVNKSDLEKIKNEKGKLDDMKVRLDESIVVAQRKQSQSQFRSVDCKVSRCIALTFDDGPHATLTPRLLDMLEKRNAVATFYVLGSRVQGQGKILERALSRGSEIGNHTWDHPNLTKLSPQEINQQINNTNNAIFNATGTYPYTMRPTYGAVNQKVLNSVGMPAVNWSIDTEDWKIKNSQKVAQHAISHARPGAIILMHDIHPTTIDAVPEILDTLIDQGYMFVTVSQLLGINSANHDQFAGKVYRDG